MEPLAITLDAESFFYVDSYFTRRLLYMTWINSWKGKMHFIVVVESQVLNAVYASANTRPVSQRRLSIMFYSILLISRFDFNIHRIQCQTEDNRSGAFDLFPSLEFFLMVSTSKPNASSLPHANTSLQFWEFFYPVNVSITVHTTTQRWPTFFCYTFALLSCSIERDATDVMFVNAYSYLHSQFLPYVTQCLCVMQVWL